MNNYYLHRKLNRLYRNYIRNRADVDNIKLLIGALSELALDYVIRHSTCGNSFVNICEVRDFMIDFTKSYRDDNFCIDLINSLCYQFG